MKKLSNTVAELEKSVAYKEKACIWSNCDERNRTLMAKTFLFQRLLTLISVLPL